VKDKDEDLTHEPEQMKVIQRNKMRTLTTS
jgi:hypothetical protein